MRFKSNKTPITSEETLMVFLVLLLFFQSIPSRITETYIAEVKRTYLKIEMIGIDRKGEKRLVQMVASYPGKTYAKLEDLTLSIETSHPIALEEMLGIKQQLAIFADGVRLDSYTLAATPIKMNAETHGLGSTFPVEHLSKLGAAKSIRIILAGIEVTIDGKEAKAIKELSDRLH